MSQVNFKKCGLFVLLIVEILNLCPTRAHQCAVGLKTPGHTWPTGDIVLEHGNSLRMQCILDEKFIASSFPGKNSSDLAFFHNNKEIEPEFITILNDTAIQLDIERPAPAEDTYYCKLRLGEKYGKDFEAVCLNKVVVGFKPSEPDNFTCVSHNWENMTCSWEPPENYVTTKYSIMFKLPGRAGGRKMYPCPNDTNNNGQTNSCFWGSSTDPIYRQVYEYYTFYMKGENVLGTWNGTYKFHHYAHVIPAPPLNLTVLNKTMDSVMLFWSVAFPMENFPPGLHYRVAYQSQWDDRNSWQIINITNETHILRRYFNLTGLKYSNAVYDVRVYAKSAFAFGEDKWSHFSGITFRTPSKVPGMSPRVDIGSFEVSENNANRDVYLYWQPIPAYLENGDLFKYQVSFVEENGRRVYLSPSELTRTYAKYRGLGLHSSYRFEIVASNQVGIHDVPAKIFLPSRNSMPKEPLAFTKIAFENGLYELSWKPPSGGEITSYTIFWCNNDRDRPWQCTGYLDWVQVPRDTVIYNMTVPDPRQVYQFAISANTPKASSGMVWASCTVIHNKVVGKMKTVWINRIGSSFIEVGWKLDCSDRIGMVEGFKIYYCPIKSPFNLNCKGPKLNRTINADISTIRGTIDGLKPYTTYMLAVAVITKNGEAQHSDPLYNTTLEAAPSDPPRDVVVKNVTNTTMFLEWKQPLAMNGVLRYYVVHYNGLSRKVEEVTHVQLEGLQAYRNYSVSVSACTVACSDASKPTYVMSDIGVPEKILPPTVRFVNSSQVRVLWIRPSNPWGPISYYQIYTSTGEFQNTTKLDAYISIPDCNSAGSEKLYRFQVRAVNIANGENLYGPWSDAGEGNCYSNGPTYIVWVIIWVIGSISGIAFVFCLAYSSKRMWLKCRAMQDVDVKLPPGLAPNMRLLQKTTDQHLRQSSTDSSGCCSSAQESVTSSLTSDSHISSDSGADVDPSSTGKQKKLGDSTNAWESSSLRQRNVGTIKSNATNNIIETPKWDPYVKVAPTESVLADSLSLVRSTPNLSDSAAYQTLHQTWSSTGYISMPSSEEISNNSNTISDKKRSNPENYSVVGIMDKKCLERSQSQEGVQMKEQNNLASKNPYITFTSLQQTLNNTQATKPSELSSTNHELTIPINKRITNSPYVQNSLIEAPKLLVCPTSRHKNLPVDNYSNSLIESKQQDFLNSAKPYVTVSSFDNLRKPQVIRSASDSSRRPYAVVALTKDAEIQKNTIFDVLHENKNVEKPEATFNLSVEENGLYPSLDFHSSSKESLSSLPSCSSSESSVNSSLATFKLTWQQEKLNHEDSIANTKESFQKLTSGYVSLPDQASQQNYNQFIDKSSSDQLQVQINSKGGQSDEQYSKVAVVPSAMH